ncbi:MAG: glycerol-3-phosphate dehydrogenase subunit GlpB [Rhodoferax sp.]|uniref:glycerol-3-phosphate dehydrogenase subunit GlpB n=1 Tax=Rhodoferax sp. TaxID=50421 RepID=UPI002627B47F|nr:glycerol-3-phosphate dehydrogenase subunit GlpB [Rhodoferax sp.]MDD5334556.1 glycerol-3-phosphate dehydrogenase subunit GlpB [Rhodoferax sp.]
MSDGAVKRYDVAVIGAGMAGMAAALFAAQRGLSCIQVGSGGGILFASGLLDLLAVHPVVERRLWQSPYAALAALAREQPEHPLARVAPVAIRAAFERFVAALAGAGMAYAPLGERNSQLLTSIGTVKTTLGVPLTMVAGVAALERRPACLLVDFRGLREFSARQIAETLAQRWPDLRHQRIDFPGFEAVPEVYAVHLAQALESRETRERTIALIKPQLGDARAVGLPAVLGLARSREVHAAFEAGLGLPVFEIPTMPTSVPGLRLLGALEAAVSSLGVLRRQQTRVRALTWDGSKALLDLEGVPGGERVCASAVVLATGRFSGQGLTADRQCVRESLLSLPVQQPAARDAWHQRDFLDPAGHAINRAGLSVDDAWRPLDASGQPAWTRLFAIGSILAQQDWMRAKCGSGLAIATAWAAIAQLTQQLRGTEAG